MDESLTVLIIDDLKSAREEIIELLCQYIPTLNIFEAEDGLDGYAIIQKNKNKIDVVFTDINMPQVNGLKLIKILREVESFKSLPIIVISVLDASADIEKALQLGATGYITKPVKQEDFDIIYESILEPIIKRKIGE